MITPFYDPKKTYAENCEHGPFGTFADNEQILLSPSKTFSFLGFPVDIPFGIPAGPVPNSAFCQAAFQKGFSIVVYKTVRTASHPCHAFPNILPVKTEKKLTLEQAAAGLVTTDEFIEPIAITNSFGVPSLDPSVWQPDMKKAVAMAKKGQILVASFQATNRGQGREMFLQDWKYAAQLVHETGAPAVEMNLSCPNEGHGALLCYDLQTVQDAIAKVREAMPTTPIILKISYFKDNAALEKFIDAVIPTVQAISAINTIAGEVRNAKGEQALPGAGRLVSGICGAPIKWAGLEMTTRLKAIREKLQKPFTIIGCGGVTTVADYHEYQKAGADAVMSATGAMWNPYLARDIANSV